MNNIKEILFIILKFPYSDGPIVLAIKITISVDNILEINLYTNTILKLRKNSYMKVVLQRLDRYILSFVLPNNLK
jgi:hypothetical protein